MNRYVLILLLLIPTHFNIDGFRPFLFHTPPIEIRLIKAKRLFFYRPHFCRSISNTSTTQLYYPIWKYVLLHTSLARSRFWYLERTDGLVESWSDSFGKRATRCTKLSPDWRTRRTLQRSWIKPSPIMWSTLRVWYPLFCNMFIVDGPTQCGLVRVPQGRRHSVRGCFLFPLVEWMSWERSHWLMRAGSARFRAPSMPRVASTRLGTLLGFDSLVQRLPPNGKWNWIHGGGWAQLQG